MKAKACTRCRQSKLRCNSDITAPGPCSRCLSLDSPCVFDRSFQSTSRTRRLVELEAEVKRLREVAGPTHDVQVPPTDPSMSTRPEITATQPSHLAALADKTIGDVTLTACRVAELFQLFFTQCHPYLPFSMATDPELIYAKSQLLFWAICAVAPAPPPSPGLQPQIQAMLGQVVVSPPRSVEAVQALLILCMWPFPFYSTLGDPSFLYSGIATQIGLQIGLHKPGLAQEFSSRQQVLEVSDEVRTSTWMACYVVGQMQGGRLGVPSPVQVDVPMLDIPDILDRNCPLTALCRISRITIHFTTMIGASTRNATGLLDPPTRIDLVKYFSKEFDKLHESHLHDMSLPIKVAYLTSKLQLWSFILHDDIACSQDVIEFFYQAEEDACAILQIATKESLPNCPFHLTRSVLYSALILIEILASPFSRQPKALYEEVQLAARLLSSASRIEDDHAQRWSRHLQKLVTLRDLKRTPPIRSRMAASIVYDAIRVMKEHLNLSSAERPLGSVIQTSADGSGADFPPEYFDLDGVNWDDLEGLF